MLLHPETKTVRFSAAFARKQGTNGSNAPSGSAAYAVKPDTTLKNVPKMAKEVAKLAILDQAGLVTDADAFVSVSQGEHGFRFVWEVWRS